MSSYNLPYNITNTTNQKELITGILRFMTNDLPEIVVNNCISYFENYLNLSIGPWTYRISSQKKIKEIIEIKENNDFCDYNICTSKEHPFNEVNTNIGFNSGPYVYQGSVFSAVVNKHNNNNNTISLALCIIEKINNENTIKYMFSLIPKSNSLGNVYIHNFSKEKTQITKKFYIMPFTSSSNYCKGHNNIKQEIFDEYKKNGKKIIL
jgi:hypothetical protein